MAQNKLNILFVFDFNYSLKIWRDSGALERACYYFEKLGKENNIHFTLINYGEYEDHEFLLKSLMNLIQDIAISQFEKKGAKNNINDYVKTDTAKLQFLYQLGISNLKHLRLVYDSFSILKLTL